LDRAVDEAVVARLPRRRVASAVAADGAAAVRGARIRRLVEDRLANVVAAVPLEAVLRAEVADARLQLARVADAVAAADVLRAASIDKRAGWLGRLKKEKKSEDGQAEATHGSPYGMRDREGPARQGADRRYLER
jgi:hypothetical protein